MQRGGHHLEPSGSRAALSAVCRESIAMSSSDKPSLRQTLRTRRRAIPTETAQSAARQVALCATALPGWPQLKSIALYLASDGELNPEPLVTACRAAGKQVYLPVVGENASLRFRRWRTSDQLTPNRYGIPEPPTSAPELTAAELDLVLLPLVAWDRQGGRLGMGGGYYDRALAAAPNTRRLGLAYAMQEVDAVPIDTWDVCLDGVLTECGLWLRQTPE